MDVGPWIAGPSLGSPLASYVCIKQLRGHLFPMLVLRVDFAVLAPKMGKLCEILVEQPCPPDKDRDRYSLCFAVQVKHKLLSRLV